MSRQEYNCKVTPTDVLAVYPTVDESKGELFAMVIASSKKMKTSVLLSKDDVARLRNRLDVWLAMGV